MHLKFLNTKKGGPMGRLFVAIITVSKSCNLQKNNQEKMWAFVDAGRLFFLEFQLPVGLIFFQKLTQLFAGVQQPDPLLVI